MPNWLKILLALALSACAPAGNFCDVVKGAHLFAGTTSAAIIATDHAEAVKLSAENAYGRAHCAWTQGGGLISWENAGSDK